MTEISYKVILFDLFHTLVNVGSAPGCAGRYTADVLGLGREEWNQACFGAVHDICNHTDDVDVVRALAHSLDPTIPESMIREAAVERRQRFSHALVNVEPEVLSVLGELREAGVRLGLLSNASSGEVRAWFRSPLAPLFERTFFSCECGYAKPDPLFYQHALSQMGVTKGECLFVGDGGSNEHEGAKRVGLDNVLITRHIGHLDASRFAARRTAARWEITTLAEIWPLLQKPA